MKNQVLVLNDWRTIKNDLDKYISAYNEKGYTIKQLEYKAYESSGTIYSMVIVFEKGE